MMTTVAQVDTRPSTTSPVWRLGEYVAHWPVLDDGLLWRDLLDEALEDLEDMVLLDGHTLDHVRVWHLAEQDDGTFHLLALAVVRVVDHDLTPPLVGAWTLGKGAL
jgi:hypothetical protein